MRAIDDVRTFFMQSAGEEEKIVQILQIFLEKIDKKKTWNAYWKEKNG